jgi:hypothetical protein
MQRIDSGVQPSAAPKPSVRTAGIAGADSFRIVRSLTIGALLDPARFCLRRGVPYRVKLSAIRRRIQGTRGQANTRQTPDRATFKEKLSTCCRFFEVNDPK